eukprot:gene30604-35618_t
MQAAAVLVLVPRQITRIRAGFGIQMLLTMFEGTVPLRIRKQRSEVHFAAGAQMSALASMTIHSSAGQLGSAPELLEPLAVLLTSIDVPRHMHDMLHADLELRATINRTASRNNLRNKNPH